MHPRDAALFVLKRVLAEGQKVQAAAEQLCDACVAMQERSHGASDNTSAVVVSLPQRPVREASVRGGKVFLSIQSHRADQHGVEHYAI
jgi:hypothetical protein